MDEKKQTLDGGRSGLSKLEKVQSLAENLSIKDMKALSSWISFRLSSDKAENSDFSLFYNIVLEELRKKGIHSFPVSVYLKNSKIGTKNFDKVQLFIDDSCSDVSKVQKIDIYRLFTVTLIYYMDHRGIPLSMNSFMSSLSYLPGVFRIAYPGIIEAGLLKTVSKMPNIENV